MERPQVLCISPIAPRALAGRQVACGQCMNCRINHKLKWLGRLVLEAQYKPYAFVTLTYAEEHRPRNHDVSRAELKAFIDKFRAKAPGTRFFGVGEYGEQSGREHYHVILFGIRATPEWKARVEQAWSVQQPRTGEVLWQKGLVDVQDPRDTSALAYTLGYVTKKMTSRHDDRLDGRAPEFFAASNKPRLGYNGLHHIARMLTTVQGSEAIADKGFPRGFVLGGQYFPFHRADRDWLMERSGYGEDYNEHLEDMKHPAWLQYERYALFRQAQAQGWTSAKLRDEIYLMENRLDEETQERRRRQAAQRAAKRKRRHLQLVSNRPPKDPEVA